MSRLSRLSAESSIRSFSIRSLGISDNTGLESFGGCAGCGSSDSGGGHGCIIAFAMCPAPAPKSTTVLNCRFISCRKFKLYLKRTMNRSTSRVATSSLK